MQVGPPLLDKIIMINVTGPVGGGGGKIREACKSYGIIGMSKSSDNTTSR